MKYVGDAYGGFAAASSPRLEEFNAQDISNLAWAFATAGCSDPAILEVVSELPGYAVPKLQTFTSQGLANTVWALATLGAADRHALAPFAAEASRRFDRAGKSDASRKRHFKRSDAAKSYRRTVFVSPNFSRSAFPEPHPSFGAD